MAPAGYEGASNFSFPWHFPTSSGVSLQGEKSVSSLPPPNFTVELVGLEFPGAAPATPVFRARTLWLLQQETHSACL